MLTRSTESHPAAPRHEIPVNSSWIATRPPPRIWTPSASALATLATAGVPARMRLQVASTPSRGDSLDATVAPPTRRLGMPVVAGVLLTVSRRRNSPAATAAVSSCHRPSHRSSIREYRRQISELMAPSSPPAAVPMRSSCPVAASPSNRPCLTHDHASKKGSPLAWGGTATPSCTRLKTGARRAWNQYQQTFATRGLNLSSAPMFHPRFRDDQNLAATPLIRSWFVRGPHGGPALGRRLGRRRSSKVQDPKPGNLWRPSTSPRGFRS